MLLGENPAPPDYLALARVRFGDLPVAPTLVVGDSHVQEGHFGEPLGRHSRRGIGGMSLADVTTVLPVVASPEVQLLILWAGTNDFHRSRDQVAADVAALLRVAHECCPVARVVLVGSPTATAVNTVLAAAGVEFVDTSAAGRLTSDGVHLSSSGYALVNEMLAQLAG